MYSGDESTSPPPRKRPRNRHLFSNSTPLQNQPPQFPHQTKTPTPLLLPDRISLLPNSIILHILSLLPTKDAIRTGVLSKRWQNLWPSLQNLSFRYTGSRSADEDQDIDYILPMVNFVTGVLLANEAPRIRSFEVDLPFWSQFQDPVTKWIRFLTHKAVEELHLRLVQDDGDFAEIGEDPKYDMLPFILPRSFYCNDVIKGMTLEWSLVKPPFAVSWPCLRRLTLSYVLVREDDIRNVLVGSPKLETLVFANCKGFSFIDTGCSASLRTLEVHDFGDGMPGTLRISAPHVESITLKEFFNDVNVKLEDVSCLKDATIDIETPDEDEYYIHMYKLSLWTVVNLLRSLAHVRKLTVGYWCIKALAKYMIHVPSPLPLSNWKSLTLKARLSGMETPGITALLENSPNLETLVADTTQEIPDQWNPYTRFVNQGRISRLPQQRFNFKHLKLAKIIYSKTDEPYKVGSVMEFMSFLVANAGSLQLMMINKTLSVWDNAGWIRRNVRRINNGHSIS